MNNCLPDFSVVRWAPPLPPQMQEEQTIKRSSNGIGLSLLSSYLLMNLLSPLFLALTNALGFHRTFFFDPGFGGMHPVLYYLINGNAYLLALVLPFALYLKISHAQINDLMPFRKAGFLPCLELVFMGLSVCVLANYAVDLLCGNLSLIGIYPYLPDSPYSSEPLALLLFILTTALFPAFAEEFVFRGVIMGSLRRFGDGFAVFASALIFGLFHGNLVQIPFAFLIGLVLGFVAVQTNSMWPSVWIHFLNNFYSCVMKIFSLSVSGKAFGLIFAAVTLLMLLLGLVGFFFTARRDSKFLCFKKAEGESSFRTKLGHFFSSPGMIIILIFLGLQTLLLVQVRL